MSNHPYPVTVCMPLLFCIMFLYVEEVNLRLEGLLLHKHYHVGWDRIAGDLKGNRCYAYQQSQALKGQSTLHRSLHFI